MEPSPAPSGPHNPDETYVAHDVPTSSCSTPARSSSTTRPPATPSQPALLLIPGQTESWWGYEAAIDLLKDRFQVFAVDLRGQGRSGRTPGRYTLDNMGNDLVRFIQGVIGRPTIVSGLSSGGVLSAWLSAYAPPGPGRAAAYYEDPPLFSSEIRPACGQGIRQSIGPIFALWAKYLGDQWSIGDWAGLVANAAERAARRWHGRRCARRPDEPPQSLKEYDPEWGRAFWTGTVGGQLRPRPDAGGGEGPGALHPPLPPRRRDDAAS